MLNLAISLLLAAHVNPSWHQIRAHTFVFDIQYDPNLQPLLQQCPLKDQPIPPWLEKRLDELLKEMQEDQTPRGTEVMPPQEPEDDDNEPCDS